MLDPRDDLIELAELVPARDVRGRVLLLGAGTRLMRARWRSDLDGWLAILADDPTGRAVRIGAPPSGLLFHDLAEDRGP